MPSLILFAVLVAAAAPRAAPEERLTPAARQDRAHQALEKMRGLVSQVAKVVQQAKDEKDLVKLNCANEKLAQVQGLLRVGEQAETELRGSVARKEEDAQDRSLARVGIAGRKIGQLFVEAQQCIGQFAFYTDEKTVVDVEEPTGLPRDPANPAPPLGMISRPPPASGF